MDDETLFKGCTVFEQITEAYDSEVVSVFFDQGTCSDFTMKYHEIAFHELETDQMQVVFQNLGIGSGVQSIIVSRAVACDLAPFAQQVEDREVIRTEDSPETDPDNHDQKHSRTEDDSEEDQENSPDPEEPDTVISQEPETVYPAEPTSVHANMIDEDIITLTKDDWLDLWETLKENKM